MNDKQSRSTIKYDLILVGILLLAGAAIFLALFLGKKSGGSVIVYVQNKVIAQYPLDTDRTELIHGLSNGTNLLIIRDGSAYIEEASCPDGLCKGMGKISYDEQSIICLPNKVVIEIVSENKTEVDIIAK